MEATFEPISLEPGVLFRDATSHEPPARNRNAQLLAFRALEPLVPFVTENGSGP
jgi:hypothetical protein